MKIALVWIIVLVAGTGIVRAQEEESRDEDVHRLVPPSDLEATRIYQSEEIVIRKFGEDDWKAIVGDVDYSEEVKPDKSEPKRSFSPVFSWGGPLLRFIAYMMAGIAVAIAVYFVVRNFPRDLKYGKTSRDSVDLAQNVEDIATLDARALLDRAIKAGDLRLAVRLYYLYLLKQLNGKGLIAWKKDKTNRDYLGELFSRNFWFKDIRHLTFAYEAVWYGEHDLQPQSFKELSVQFETIIQKIEENEG